MALASIRSAKQKENFLSGNLEGTLVSKPQIAIIVQNIKHAYKFRNAVVHASPRTVRIKDEQGDPIEVEQFVGIIQEYTHRALRLMIERAADVDEKEPLFQWNTLILNQNAPC